MGFICKKFCEFFICSNLKIVIFNKKLKKNGWSTTSEAIQLPAWSLRHPTAADARHSRGHRAGARRNFGVADGHRKVAVRDLCCEFEFWGKKDGKFENWIEKDIFQEKSTNYWFVSFPHMIDFHHSHDEIIEQKNKMICISQQSTRKLRLKSVEKFSIL